MNAPACEVRPPRVMWLLNHGTLREFEMRQLESLGVQEIFLPKRFPYDEGNLSASIDASRDASLTLEEGDLRELNAQDWYGQPSERAWSIANRHFDILFFAFFPRQVESVSRHFQGNAILRVFGHARGYTYSDLLYQHIGVPGVERIQRMGDRFWFGQAYEHLHEIEHDFIKRRSCYLPLGLKRAVVEDGWRGDDRRLYFVCPRIGSSGHFRSVFAQFRLDFDGVPFVVAGAQPIRIDDPRVLGYVAADAHRENMRRFRVMYYHSDEPNHVHYHPFEAVRAGMPLVFLGGGMLDRLGGRTLPGRCRDVREARRKIERILAGDRELVASIRESQPQLLEAMRPEVCEPVWRRNFGRIIDRPPRRPAVGRKGATRRKVAVLLPSVSRPVFMMHARRIAKAIQRGSALSGSTTQVVLAAACSYSVDPRLREAMEEDGLSARSFRWMRITSEYAEIAARFAGHRVRFSSNEFIVPDDGINQLLDCDAWIVTSDDLSFPLLPLRPYILTSLGYPQRYSPMIPQGADAHLLQAAVKAAQVWAPTLMACNDVAQYAGVPPERIRHLPMPRLQWDWPERAMATSSPVFALVLEGLPEQSQLRGVDAVSAYYDRLAGTLSCMVITGPAAEGERLSETLPAKVRDALHASRRTRARVSYGTSNTFAERLELHAAVRFVIYPNRFEDRALHAHDALGSGLPILVDRSPCWEEPAEQFKGQVVQVEFDNALDAARAIKALEDTRMARRTGDTVSEESSSLYSRYWQALRDVM